MVRTRAFCVPGQAGFQVAAVSEAAKAKALEYHREYQRRKRMADPEGCRVAANEWARANRDKRRAVERRYAETHPEAIKAKQERRKPKIRAWLKADREASPEKYQERFSRWHEQNGEYNTERQRAWRALNPAALKAQSNRRRARKIAAPGDGVTREQWQALLDSYLGLCIYCGAPATDMDHVDPLSKGGAHDTDNVAPACGSCNSSKNNYTLTVWLVRRSLAGGRMHKFPN